MKNYGYKVAAFAAFAVVFLLLVGCAPQQADQEAAWKWAAVTVKADEVPEECLREAPKEPKDPNRELSDKDSAREARKILLWGRAVRKDHSICQTWAKGQRP